VTPGCSKLVGTDDTVGAGTTVNETVNEED
jgi:hypothetical protein